MTGCPMCGAALALRDHESIQLLACPDGHGVFIHAEALQVAVRDRTADRPEHEERAAEREQRAIPIEQLDQREQPRQCPTCGAEMAKRVFAYESGVAMDVCDEHGIWLDQGELQQIEAWYEAQERHRASDREQWGGQTGRLERIEEDFERQAARDAGSVHWGPVGWFVERAEWARMRRDDR